MGRQVLVGAATVALLAACTTPPAGVTFEDPVSPPPDRGTGDAPLALVEVRGVPAAGPGEMRAIAAGASGYVAVGRLDDGGPADEALLLHSSNGAAWQRVGPSSGLDVVDVAAGPTGFVAVGTRQPADGDIRSAFLVSPDGIAWSLLESAAYGGIDAYVNWVEADGREFRAGGGRIEGDHGATTWSSADGHAWLVDPDPVDLAAPIADGWLEVRGVQVRLRRNDGTTTEWTLVEEPPGDPTVVGLWWAAGGGDGMLVGGGIGSPCGRFGSCAADGGAWWSADGATWRLLPAEAPGWAFHHAAASATGGRLLVAGNGRVAASLDGWHWDTLLDGTGIAEAHDVTAHDGVVVVVGVDWSTGGARPVLLTAVRGS